MYMVRKRERENNNDCVSTCLFTAVILLLQLFVGFVSDRLNTMVIICSLYTFAVRLSEWNWEEEPLFVDLAGSLDESSKQNFVSHFKHLKTSGLSKHMHLPSLCVATAFSSAATTTGSTDTSNNNNSSSNNNKSITSTSSLSSSSLVVAPASLSSPTAAVVSMVVTAARNTVTRYFQQLEQQQQQQQQHGQQHCEEERDWVAAARAEVWSSCNVLFSFRSCLTCDLPRSSTSSTSTSTSTGVSMQAAARGASFASMTAFANLPPKALSPSNLLVRYSY